MRDNEDVAKLPAKYAQVSGSKVGVRNNSLARGMGSKGLV